MRVHAREWQVVRAAGATGHSAGAPAAHAAALALLRPARRAAAAGAPLLTRAAGGAAHVLHRAAGRRAGAQTGPLGTAAPSTTTTTFSAGALSFAPTPTTSTTFTATFTTTSTTSSSFCASTAVAAAALSSPAGALRPGTQPAAPLPVASPGARQPATTTPRSPL